MIFNKKNGSSINTSGSDKARKIAIVGLPNTGKSLIFNNLTGEYTVVANYPLSTIKPKNSMALIGNTNCDIIDTPGIHSLYIHSDEELVVREILFSEKPDVIVQCIDANRLKQSLILTADLLELEIPLVISLNFIDETSKNGIWIDSGRLSVLLGIPVIESVAIRNIGTEELKHAISNARRGKSSIRYGEILENGITDLESKLPPQTLFKRTVAILLLQDDPYLAQSIEQVHGGGIGASLGSEALKVKQRFRGNLKKAINHRRNKWVDDISEQVVRKQKIKLGGLSQVIGQLSRHPLFGFPILMASILIMYFLVANIAIGASDWMHNSLWTPIEHQIGNWIPAGFWYDLLIGDYGILSLGLANAIITILPILILFFIFFSILEDTGYLANLSVLTKRILEKFGLSGGAVMPMVLGTGCKTMATLTTKSLQSSRERYITICIIAFGIPCSAQLGINIAILSRLGINAFIIAFSVLILIDIVVGLALNKFLKDEKRSSFMQELPEICLPNIKAVIKKTYYRLFWFLEEAVPMFMIASALLFFMDKVGMLAGLKHILRPVIGGFLGFPEGMVDVLIVCIARHEAAAAMIMNLVDKGLLNYVQSIVAVLIIMMIPCFANVGAIVKEIGSKKAFNMVISIYIGAFIIAGGLNWVLVFIFNP